MHELGLLHSVVTAVENATGDATVEAVGLRVGALSGAVPEALHGAWPIAVAGTRLDGAALQLEEIPARIWCPGCAAEVEVDEFYALTCPVCGTPSGTLVSGREFEIAYAEIHDPPPDSQPSSTAQAAATAPGTAAVTGSLSPSRRSTDSGTTPMTTT